MEQERQPAPAGPDPRVMEMVRQQLERRRPPALAALYGRAVRIDPAIRGLSLRQFNARYPLRVRRERKRERKRERSTARRGADEEIRTRVRAVLLRFARSVTAAETTAALIDALEEVDLYVDAVVEGARRDAQSPSSTLPSSFHR